MSDPWFKRDGWEARPGLHAFVVGISAYAHLPLPAEPLLAQHFGMRQLSSPALTAYRVATLLKEQADQFDPPLATCRVLLAPSAAEIAIEPALTAFADTVPDFDNFSAFAMAWRADASRHAEGMAFFYHAGHGLERETKEHVLLLHNFGSGKGATFSHKAVNIRHLLDGMAASEGQTTIARKQVYFFDTCRSTDEAVNGLAAPETGNIWDYQGVPDKDDRLSAWFFAAKAGDEAFAERGGETLFGCALLQCLRGGAGVSSIRSDPDSDWIVTINSLHQRLEAFIDVGNRDAGAAQSRNVQFIDGNMRLLRLARRPEVKVLLTVQPVAAVGVAAVSVVSLDGEVLKPLEPRAPNHNLYEHTAPAGSMIVLAVTDPARDGWQPKVRKVFVIEPPETPCPLSLA